LVLEPIAILWSSGEVAITPMGNNDKKGDKTSSGSGVVVQLVVHEVSGRISYHVLIKGNYSNWALLMKVKLKARALWNVVEKGVTDIQEELMALDALCSVVPPEIIPSIAKMETAKEAWEAIATMRIGDDQVKKSTAQQLWQKFDMATCGEGETIEDYALCLNGMVAHLTTLGKGIKESQVVEKMMHSLPS
jgi:hypothetical protein